MFTTGGIEAGGTKFICGVGTGPDDLETVEFPTTTPDETVARAVEFFRAQGSVRCIGIGSFGPVDLNLNSSTYGYITMTPKLAWRNFDLAGAIRRGTGAEVAFDTDVNAAALGEHRWGVARGLDTFIYLTIGTGVGGGGMANGRLMHGFLHPEMGHIRIPHDLRADPYPGHCPSHGDCLEGLACGPAIEARWGAKGVELPADHPAWDLEANYLALGIANWIFTLSPQKVVLGGGVMKQEGMLPKIRARVDELINGYLQAPPIVAPELGGRAGILGSIALCGFANAAAPC
jgi:fructokinase